MSNAWHEAHSQLCAAAIAFRDADGLEEEAVSAIEDVYHESDEHYDVNNLEPKLPKPQKT